MMSDFTDNLNRLNQKMAKVAMEKKAAYGIEKEAYLHIMERYLRKQATDNYVTLRNQYLGSSVPTNLATAANNNAITPLAAPASKKITGMVPPEGGWKNNPELIKVMQNNALTWKDKLARIFGTKPVGPGRGI